MESRINKIASKVVNLYNYNGIMNIVKVVEKHRRLFGDF